MEINFPAKLPDNVKPPKINNALTFLLTREGADGKENAFIILRRVLCPWES